LPQSDKSDFHDDPPGNKFPSTNWHRSPAALPPRQDGVSIPPALAEQNDMTIMASAAQ
jgi:hypothetical protein